MLPLRVLLLLPLVTATAAPQGDPLAGRPRAELLVAERGCASCHQGVPTGGLAPLAAPDLKGVGERNAPDHLRRWILEPGAIRPGSAMPQVLGHLPDEEQARVAEDLVHFLASRSFAAFISGSADDTQAALGQRVFQRVGCQACHEPGDLDHVAEKWALEPLADFLHDPLKLRPSGQMPDMGLTRAEAGALAAYLAGAGTRDLASLTPDPARAARGAELYVEHGCAACHPLDGLAATPLRPAPRDLTAGCLAEAPGAAPNFGLDAEQRKLLRLPFTTEPAPLPAATRIAQTLEQLQCVACHERDGYGGVDLTQLELFGTDEPELGDAARIPPPLTGVGAKLTPEALRRVLYDGERVRPYMHVRMPNYGRANLAHLPALFEAEDQLEPYPLAAPKRDQERAYRDAGRQLLGNRGVSCVSCHTYKGKEGPGFQGLELLTFPERLQPDWFAHFTVNPQRFRPGIVMPESWPGGEAAHQGILEGDTQAQLEAIWHFLRLGTSGRDPDGVQRVPTHLDVGELPRTYRGRSRVAGFRGIAVGFPGGINYALNAETGALSALWRGDFVSVQWDGQGAGNFHPRSRPIELAQDLALYRLKSNGEPWPRLPVMTEEQPVNPDPLYPRNRGYQFLGYALGPDRVPTFRYRSGAITVADRSVPDPEAERPTLVRTLTFDAPAAETLTLRLFTGAMGSVDGGMANEQLAVTHDLGRPILRQTDEPGATPEYLLHLDLKAGTTTLTLRYELLR